MSDPFTRRPLRLTADDRAAWRKFEARNALAAQHYKEMPNSYHLPGPAAPCGRCGRQTKAKGLVCKPCRTEGASHA